MAKYIASKKEKSPSKPRAKKYAVVAVDVSSIHRDANLEDIASHYPSERAFVMEDIAPVLFIKDLQHPVNFHLKLNDKGNDGIFFKARLDKISQAPNITELFFTNASTSTKNVILFLIGQL